MRTTLTLDPDVVRLVSEAVHQQRKPMKQVINNALRAALADHSPREPYVVVPHIASIRPGLDMAGFNRLADEL
ncbi:MAG: type II toxin-antitoxin system antitoxin VapB33 [Actinomycetota bacterium]